MNKKLSVFNLRVGLACNSSSSHSILVLPDNSKTSKIKTDEYTDFHWSFFTASDEESKNNYLAAAVSEAIRNTIPESEQEEFLRKFFKEETVNSGSSIDHQSIPLIPFNFKGGVNEEFIRDFQEFLSQPNVVIAGGNDNDDQEHKLVGLGQDFVSSYPVEVDNSAWIARKDREQNYWTIFNRVTGSKMRFAFGESIKPTKAFSPELVDVKITDYCVYDCDFCYQDSTIKGEHADFNTIRIMLDKLADAEVYEIAFGGGETTLHPNFVEILKLTKEKGIVANFTTKNFNLLRSKSASEIVDYSGAIAFSVGSVLDIEKVYSSYLDFKESEKLETLYNARALINLQYVMGTTSIEEFKNIIRKGSESNFNITLLGYKENGRGSTFSAEDYSKWISVLKDVISELKKEHIYPQISIDTALAAQYKKELLNAGVNENTFHTSEGTFSLYIDAVANTMSPSSYIGFDQTKPFDNNWLENYKIMGIEASSEKPKKKIKIH